MDAFLMEELSFMSLHADAVLLGGIRVRPICINRTGSLSSGYTLVSCNSLAARSEPIARILLFLHARTCCPFHDHCGSAKVSASPLTHLITLHPLAKAANCLLTSLTPCFPSFSAPSPSNCNDASYSNCAKRLGFARSQPFSPVVTSLIHFQQMQQSPNISSQCHALPPTSKIHAQSRASKIQLTAHLGSCLGVGGSRFESRESK